MFHSHLGVYSVRSPDKVLNRTFEREGEGHGCGSGDGPYLNTTVIPTPHKSPCLSTLG